MDAALKQKTSRVTFQEGSSAKLSHMSVKPSKVSISSKASFASYADPEGAPADSKISPSILSARSTTSRSASFGQVEGVSRMRLTPSALSARGEGSSLRMRATRQKSKVVFKEEKKKEPPVKKGKAKAGKKAKSPSPTKGRPKKSALKSPKHPPPTDMKSSSQIKSLASQSVMGEDEFEWDGESGYSKPKRTRRRSSRKSMRSMRSTRSVRSSSKSSSVFKDKSGTLQSSSSIFSISGSSSSSSEEVIEVKRRKSTKKPKKKVKPEQWSIEEEEEEILQKIVVPSDAGLPEEPEEPVKKPKKEKKPKAKAKPKGKPKKEKKGKKTDKVQKTDAQIEEEAKAKAEEERQKFLADKRAAIAKEKRELMEDSLRGEQLDIAVEALNTCSEALEKVTMAEQEAEEWRQYLVCDGLPAPWDVPGMNTYLHLWEKEVYTVSADRCKERTTEAINLLNQLEDIIDDPFDHTERRNADWAWVASRFREFQDLNLEYCTYRLLRDIKGKLNRIDIPTADYRMEEELFSLCLWVSITLPTPVPNPRSQPKMRIQLEWPEMKVDVIFPNSLKREMVAIRGIYTKYDHLTDTCGSYKVGELPPYCTRSLSETCHDDLLKKMKYKFDHRKKKVEPVEVVQEDGTVVLVEEPVPDPELDPTEMAPTVPFQKLDVSPSAFIYEGLIDEMYNALMSFSQDDLPYYVLNLRKYIVLGGVYYLDLFHQPPQPQGMVSYEVFISTLTDPYCLQKAPFIVEYEPPPPYEPGTRRDPEEIEEELLQLERKLDELIFLQITLPTHVYWLEPPIAVQWDPEEKAWTTNTVFDFKNIEEKGYVTLRTGLFRPIAIATLRWANLPYQAWEIRPEKNDTVSFQLSCAILTIEFHVVKNTICVRDIQSAPNEAFDEHLNVYYHFSKLRKIMKSIGIDVFPYFDTFLYVEGTCEKNWPMENHTYFCMAYLSVLFNMTWSRWNTTLDYQTIVFQMRPYRFERPKQANFETVAINAQRVAYIECTEVSQEYCETPIEGMRFYADLWHLVRSTTTKTMRTRITSADKTMVKTLYRLYKNVRFLSYS